jgi:hypothetical protein
LTQQQCTLIRGLVENQASGVVFLPGSQGNQFTLLDTDLSDLVPVILDETQKAGMGESIASPLNLTTEGRASLLTMLGNNEEENPEIWRRLPGFYWHAPVIKAKGGSEVLAVHGNRRGKFGPIPLLVTKAAGSGKVLFMGIDSAWRWRRGVEDLYHYRFWGQVARWMSYQRNMAAGQRVRLYFTPERPEPGATAAPSASNSRKTKPPGGPSAAASRSIFPEPGNFAPPLPEPKTNPSKPPSSPKASKSKRSASPPAPKCWRKWPRSPAAASSSPPSSPNSSEKSPPCPNPARWRTASPSGPTGAPSPPSSPC